MFQQVFTTCAYAIAGILLLYVIVIRKEDKFNSTISMIWWILGIGVAQTFFVMIPSIWGVELSENYDSLADISVGVAMFSFFLWLLICLLTRKR